MLTRLLAQEQAVLAAQKQSQHKYLPTGEEKTVVRNQGFVVQKIGAQVGFLSREPVIVKVRVGSGTRETQTARDHQLDKICYSDDAAKSVHRSDHLS